MLSAMPPRRTALRTRIRRAARAAVLLGGVAFALPVTCARPGSGIYTGGVEPSPAGRVNPFEPGFAADGASAR